MVEKEKEVKVDDDLYSRSIFTYGMETMKKLSTMKVLIVGMRGLGVETAKNIILSGPGEVDIFDPSLVKINDLGSNFYLSEEDVGKKIEMMLQLGNYLNLIPMLKYQF
jgi:ubiquitin-activating enzyme E1